MSIIVDGVEIPETLLAEEIQNHASSSIGNAQQSAAKALAVKALLLHRADELGLVASPCRDEEGREETSEEALIRMVLSAEVAVDPPGEDACRRVYEMQRERFMTPTLVEASHILVEPEGDQPQQWEAARQAALVVLSQLEREPARFGELARSMSACPSGQVGGSLGQLGPGDVVTQVEQALAGLEAGEIAAQPVRSAFGWHILRLDRRIGGRLLPFEHVVEKIRLHLESRAWTAAAVQYVSQLADRAREHGVAFSIRRDGRLTSGTFSMGDLLNAEAAGRLEAWLDKADPAFAARVRTAAAAANQDFSAFVRQSVAHFTQHADDEAWTRLISAARDTEDAALAGIVAVLKIKLAPPSRTLISANRRPLHDHAGHAHGHHD